MTRSFTEVRSAYYAQYPATPFFDTWIPESKFLNAEFDENGNFVISREDDGIYGLALGASPKIPDNWGNFSIESRGISKLPPEYKVIVEWDSYWARTRQGTLETSPTSSDAAVDAFLKVHAPDSSVFPGNSEIIEWVEVHDESQLVAVAALCRWQSGRVVISSVATHTDLRGRGFGKALMERCLTIAGNLGEESVSLGVRHTNESAQRLYASTGFTLMHNFTYCERR
jgi:ribosomal protein S18 acetylase RimI-like enzyme